MLRLSGPDIQRESPLLDEQRTAGGRLLEKILDQAAGICRDARFGTADRDAGLAQPLRPDTCSLLSRVFAGIDHFGDAGLDQCVSAGRLPAGMAARLEGDEDGRAFDALSATLRVVDGFPFGVKPAVCAMPALTDHHAVLDQHRTDHRVGADQPVTVNRQLGGSVPETGLGRWSIGTHVTILTDL